MIIGTRQRLAKIQKNTSVSCGGKLLKQVYSKKTLGVLIDDNLCWNEQIDNISKKVSKGIGICCAMQSQLSLLKLLNIFIRL